MVGRWLTLKRVRRQTVREGHPDPREVEAENTAPSRRVREMIARARQRGSYRRDK